MISFKEYLVENKRVGKLIGGDRYVHKDYEDTLPADELNAAKKHLPADFDYHIVKHNAKDKSFSFIQSKNFNTEDEPEVQDSIKVHSSGATKLTKKSTDPKIYHHKWQFVSPEHNGFDVNESKKRSEQWKPVVDKLKEKDPTVYSKIGNKSYWEKNVTPHIGKA